jgi:hypothetical protein
MTKIKIGMVFLSILSTFGLMQVSFAEGEFATKPELFLHQVFGHSAPKQNMIWLTGEKKEVAARILGHDPEFMRLRYWGDEQRSAWIVDEIGKTEPITIGVVIANNEIELVKVLAFRESRGWEIKHDFFTKQFVGVGLNDRTSLNRNIDGISGATLSVKAMNNVSRLVLYLTRSLSS